MISLTIFESITAFFDSFLGFFQAIWDALCNISNFLGLLVTGITSVLSAVGDVLTMVFSFPVWLNNVLTWLPPSVLGLFVVIAAAIIVCFVIKILLEVLA